MKLQSALCNTISMQEAELAAANKAIVALSEALDFVQGENPIPTSGDISKSREALKTHAPAIEKARGG